MNLNTIIKSLEQIDLKHQKINQRFSAKHKDNYVYKGCLKKDEIEELRVYGHTNQDTITKFKRKFRNSEYETREEKALAFVSISNNKSETMDYLRSPTKSMYLSKNKRAKTAQNYLESSKRQEMIEKSLNHEIFKPIENINMKSSKPHTSKINREIRKKSVAKFKKEFNQNFEEDLKIVKKIISGKQIKRHTSSIVFEPNFNKEYESEKPDVEEVLFMTEDQNINRRYEKIQNNLTVEEQFEKVNKLNALIFDNFGTFRLNRERKNKRTWDNNWRELMGLENLENISFIMVSMDNLECYEIKDEEICVLHLLIEKLLKVHRILHFNVVFKINDRNEQKNIYEEFIISPMYSIHHHEISSWAFRYYFKRFMLISNHYQTLQEVNRQENILYKGEFFFYLDFNKIPKNIYRFVHELKGKSYVLIDHHNNKRSGNLGDFLEEGYKEMELRTLNWNNKGTSIGRGGHIEKKLYFYICSLLSILAENWPLFLSFFKYLETEKFCHFVFNQFDIDSFVIKKFFILIIMCFEFKIKNLASFHKI